MIVIKTIAVANSPDELEGLINKYFYSSGYELVLVKRMNKDEILEMKYIIENKRLDQDKVIMLNLDYKIICKKGKYYFCRNETKRKS